MSKKLRVSIITASYNSEKYIEQTIQSVVQQTYTNIEYIIVDGGSTDSTLEIIQKYRERVAILISEPDNGVFEAFNKGLRVATGDIIYFLNSDDFLADDKAIEDISRIFNEYPDVKFVHGNIETLNDSTGYFDISGQSVSLLDIKEGRIPPHSASFVRKEIIAACGGFDLEYKIGSDTDLIVNIFKNYSEYCLYTNRVISKFRLGGLSSQGKNRKKAIEEINNILQKHFGTRPDYQQTILNTNLKYYKKWVEILLFSDHPISSCLTEYTINNVAIFGTREIAVLMLQDLKRSSIHTVAFLDNNVLRQGKEIMNTPICSPDWLKDHNQDIDAIILAIEGEYEEEIKDQIKSITNKDQLRIFSWREIILMNPNNTFI
ncbi:glycosyltransferase family 2 protein [Paenibacillus whitsoniae]|uniref:Glycosyltransferase n=1 Tax=Paenibacillus whitsoniae TaxID=2496558 RepID=A0A3S0BJD0_9BACL|nr:glycosyltransferase family 2 protein [Paenibacillus whitsoniae]RTE07921.1 glycosyltransferase [Paenibacillus whitsoniae]